MTRTSDPDVLAAMRRHPSSIPVRYCTCRHAEQHHKPTCDVRSCICDGFSHGGE